MYETNLQRIHSTPDDSHDRPTYIHLFGLKRSGNHALIGWLMEGLDHGLEGSVLHFNDVNEPRHPADRPKPYLSTEYMHAEIEHVKPRYVIVSYEDLVFAERAQQKHYKAFPPNGYPDVLVVRSFPNLIASQIQRRRNVEARGETRNIHRLELAEVRDIWVENARAAATMAIVGSLPILYDRWFQSRQYRDDLATHLGFDNEDLGINLVPDVGQGSSFDGLTKQGHAQDMHVTRRWRLFAQDPKAAQMYADIVTPEVIELNRALFGFDAMPSTIPE